MCSDGAGLEVFHRLAQFGIRGGCNTRVSGCRFFEVTPWHKGTDMRPVKGWAATLNLLRGAPAARF